MPNQALVQEFNRFDDDKLKKLLLIGDSILTPLDTELTSVDFASMIEQVFKPNGLADRYFPEWTDRSSSDFGRFLVELFAIFSDKNFFYINHFSQEGFVGVARLYRSIFHKALNQGFNPPSNVSATGNVDIVFSAGATEFIPRGAIVLGVDTAPELTYINLPVTIPSSGIQSSATITFVHGKIRRENYTFDGYSIVLDSPNVVTGSIVLVVDGQVWQEVPNFLSSSSSDKHFMVFFDEDGKAEILFGKGGYGATPDIGSLCDVEYVVGGGYVGDILAGTVNRVIGSQTIRNLVSYTQYDISGGNDLMPMEKLRTTVIGKARHQNRVVTPEDAEYFCKELSFVEKVSAEVFLNYLYVYVLPVGGGNVSPSQVTLVNTKLTPALLMGYNLTVASPIYVGVYIEIDLYLNNNTSRSGANQICSEVVNEYLDPLKKGTFGGGVKRATLTSEIIKRVKGSNNSVVKELYRVGSPAPVTDLFFIKREVVNMATSVIQINVIGGI